MFGQEYFQNCLKLFCHAVSATSAFNLKLCPMTKCKKLAKA